MVDALAAVAALGDEDAAAADHEALPAGVLAASATMRASWQISNGTGCSWPPPSSVARDIEMKVGYTKTRLNELQAKQQQPKQATMGNSKGRNA